MLRRHRPQLRRGCRGIGLQGRCRPRVVKSTGATGSRAPRASLRMLPSLAPWRWRALPARTARLRPATGFWSTVEPPLDSGTEHGRTPVDAVRRGAADATLAGRRAARARTPHAPDRVCSPGCIASRPLSGRRRPLRWSSTRRHRPRPSSRSWLAPAQHGGCGPGGSTALPRLCGVDESPRPAVAGFRRPGVRSCLVEVVGVGRGGRAREPLAHERGEAIAMLTRSSREVEFDCCRRVASRSAAGARCSGTRRSPRR